MNPSKKLALGLVVVALGAAACSSSRVLVPPRVDLTEFGTVGLVEFAAGEEKDLGQLATQEFVSSLQAAQPGVPFLELGDQAAVLQEVGRERIDPAAVQAIGKQYRVDTLVISARRERRLAAHLARYARQVRERRAGGRQTRGEDLMRASATRVDEERRRRSRDGGAVHLARRHRRRRQHGSSAGRLVQTLVAR
jgi:hypothetical protein